MSGWMTTSEDNNSKFHSNLDEFDAEAYQRSLPPNGCDCPDCRRSWEKQQAFEAIQDKDEYFRLRKQNYEVDNMVIDVGLHDVVNGDVLFWTDMERELHTKLTDMKGFCFMGFNRQMGKDVDYIPTDTKEERAEQYKVDVDLVIANAFSDNPQLDTMHEGEISVYEKVRRHWYQTPEQHAKYMNEIWGLAEWWTKE